ncbi:hypothetical protein Micbo1qcDRAFT_201698 [Microdochium bolleyi]|uniref:Uncharacterized protein n=1 Tax=Microdochium bolleyi TaxID=196109 RepID=A0A136J9K1_9PEZI|nr:hypothetical protein Micbo1qcDRAFT_201698 [Microdochium bolleyi]
MEPPKGFSILVTEAELANVFARVLELHDETFSRTAQNTALSPLPPPLPPKNHEQPTQTPTDQIKPQNTVASQRNKNKALQCVLDDVRDGLLGLVSRTEFDRFLDGLEKENILLSARHGNRHRRILSTADRNNGASSAVGRARMTGLGQPFEDGLRRWILQSACDAETARQGTPKAAINCRWLLCGRPEQLITVLRRMPPPWAENCIFVTPVCVTQENGSGINTGNTNTNTNRLSHDNGSQQSHCDKRTVFTMLLVDLISAISGHVADESVLSGFKKADLPNIQSPQGRIQALVMVLEVCVRALFTPAASQLRKDQSQGSRATTKAENAALGDRTPGHSGRQDAGAGDDNAAAKHTRKHPRPLLLLIDRIDSVVCPETEHYVKKTITMLRILSGPLACTTAFDTRSSVSLRSRFCAELAERANDGGSNDANRDTPKDGPAIKVLFTVSDEAGRVFLEKQCGLSAVAEPVELESDLGHIVLRAQKSRDALRGQPHKTPRKPQPRGLDDIREHPVDLHHQHVPVPVVRGGSISHGDPKARRAQSRHHGGGETGEMAGEVVSPLDDKRRERSMSSIHLLREQVSPVATGRCISLPAKRARIPPPLSLPGGTTTTTPAGSKTVVRAKPSPRGGRRTSTSTSTSRKHRGKRTASVKLHLGAIKEFWSNPLRSRSLTEIIPQIPPTPPPKPNLGQSFRRDRKDGSAAESNAIGGRSDKATKHIANETDWLKMRDKGWV